MSKTETTILGHFDGDAAAPAYDPPLNSPCLYCGEVMLSGRRTHSFAPYPSGTRSYFYRTHASCDDAASPAEKRAIWEGLVAITEGVIQ